MKLFISSTRATLHVIQTYYLSKILLKFSNCFFSYVGCIFGEE